MSIKTDITRQDYTAFVVHVARTVSATNGGRIVRMFIAITMGLGIGLALALLDLLFHPSILVALLCGGVAGAFLSMAVISNVSRRQMQRMTPADDGFILGAQETFLEEEGIRLRSAHHQASFEWSLVQGVAMTAQHVYVLVDSVAGIILPKRAFSSEAELEQFVSEIERRSGKQRS